VDKRLFGLRNQYSVVFSAGGQRQLSPEEVGRRLFGPVMSGGQGSSVPHRNGGRLYLEVASYPEYATPGLRRLRVIVSDSTMSETTTMLKVGATDLVLRMAEAATVMPDLTLDRPVQAIGEVSHDITGRRRVRLANGRQVSALDIQREYLAKARDFTGKRGTDAVSRRILGMWERALDAIGTGDLDTVAREIDWVIKYQLIERYRATHDLPLSAPQVAQADLAYHDAHQGRRLYYQLQRTGAIDRTARDIDIFEAKTVPPAPGRYRQAG
jgi:proteasome accessory factor A